MRALGEDFSELADLAIVIVSTNEAHWLERCLPTVFARAGGASLDVIVVDNSSTDGTRELVESDFPRARVVDSPNRGFSYGNNRGIEQAHARYVLLLNPDTEVVDGTFGELVQLLDARPQVGLVGVRQITGDGALWPTIRRFPSVARALGEAFLLRALAGASAVVGRAGARLGSRMSARTSAIGPRARSCWLGARRC